MAGYVFQLKFKSINSAVQAGDIVYYIPLAEAVTPVYNIAQYSIGDDNSNVIKVGVVVFIDKTNNTIDVKGDFNLSNIKGYYAEIKMVSTEHNRKSELFSVNLAADESSK